MLIYRGIILFAMLNGRLPFNDSQLMEMEEDMKMQRLRFERIVSFGKLFLFKFITEACSTMRALGVLSSAFYLNASARQGAFKHLQFKSIGVSP